mgnify:FL=1
MLKINLQNNNLVFLFQNFYKDSVFFLNEQILAYIFYKKICTY